MTKTRDTEIAVFEGAEYIVSSSLNVELKNGEKNVRDLPKAYEKAISEGGDYITTYDF